MCLKSELDFCQVSNLCYEILRRLNLGYHILFGQSEAITVVAFKPQIEKLAIKLAHFTAHNTILDKMKPVLLYDAFMGMGRNLMSY